MTELDRALHKSVMKREAVKEKLAREDQIKKDEEIRLGFGGTEMSKEELRKIVDSDRRMYYRTEELNDKLYIHYKGWREICGLEGWTGLRALYAESNAFSRIQGLQNCRNLRSLFLSENCIAKIEGLENCTQLWTLNLSNNFIERIEGLSTLTNLNSLIIAKNKIGFQGLQDLEELSSTCINTLDIQDNKIWDPDCVPEVFMQMPNLRVLYLKGNPCGKKIPNYRKGITACCPDLRYLDDRPVFPEDRRAAEAFLRGGLEEERAERRRIREENNKKHDDNMKAFQAMIDAAKREKRERDEMRGEDKYTDESDPVESQEQRMKRQVDQWKADNADDLKDDLKERAQRCLQAEKEGRAPPAAVPEETDDAPIAEDTEEPEKKEDNRKLVYEDIWDDVPPSLSGSKASAPAAPSAPPAVFAPPPRTGAAPPGAGQVAAKASPAAPEVFLPWVGSSDVAGMETQPADREALESRRAAALQAAAAAGKAPDWYAKFAEVATKKATPAAAPAPAKVPAQPAEAAAAAAVAPDAESPGAELDEMD